jgi:hypothetical protein
MPWSDRFQNRAVSQVSESDGEQLADVAVERAERLAIQSEPALPPPGGEGRRVIDLEHYRTCRGLLLVGRYSK